MAHSNESRACVYLCTSKTKMSRQLLHHTHTHTKIVPSHLIDTSVIQLSVNHGADLVNLYWSWASSTQGWFWHVNMWLRVIRITLVCGGQDLDLFDFEINLQHLQWPVSFHALTSVRGVTCSPVSSSCFTTFNGRSHRCKVSLSPSS